MTTHAHPDPLMIRELVSAAVQAPSSHNTQPWLFRRSPAGLDLLADRTRALPVNDPNDRELTISCGAALYNVEIAARHLNLRPSTVLLPDPYDHDLLATTSLEPDPDPRAREQTWFNALSRRRTTRAPLSPPPSLQALDNLIPSTTQGVTFTPIGAPDRAEIAELVARGDRSQFADPRWRRELAHWMHPRRRGDGLVVSEIVGLATRAVVTAFDLGKSTAGTGNDMAQAAPMLILVTTERDDAEAWLHTGKILQQFLLTAASRGLMAGYLNQPCQVPELRSQLRQAAPTAGFPQLLIRVGSPTDQAPTTPRRPIDDVLLEPADSS